MEKKKKHNKTHEKLEEVPIRNHVVAKLPLNILKIRLFSKSFSKHKKEKAREFLRFS